MSSSSLITSHGLALATAIAVSGTLLLIALCQKMPFSLPSSSDAAAHSPPPPSCGRRPSSSSSGEMAKQQRSRQQKKKKRVRFAEEVVEFDGGARGGEDPLEERRRMPANRVALYNGILRDRVMHRMASCRGF